MSSLARRMLRDKAKAEAKKLRRGILPDDAHIMSSDAAGRVYINGEFIENAFAERDDFGNITKVILYEE